MADWKQLVVVGTLVLTACSQKGPDEHSLLEKCELLRDYCAVTGSGELRECQLIGERGTKEPDHQDQCFVAYDRCIDRCLLLPPSPDARDASAADAAAASQLAVDAATSDAAF